MGQILSGTIPVKYLTESVLTWYGTCTIFTVTFLSGTVSEHYVMVLDLTHCTIYVHIVQYFFLSITMSLLNGILPSRHFSISAF
jgi:hypothetical protein